MTEPGIIIQGQFPATAELQLGKGQSLSPALPPSPHFPHTSHI